MGQLGLIQDIKCLLGLHVRHAFNYYDDNHQLWFQDGCLNCWRGFKNEFVRYLTEEERNKPIWEILGTTHDTYYDDKLRIPFLEEK